MPAPAIPIAIGAYELLAGAAVAIGAYFYATPQGREVREQAARDAAEALGRLGRSNKPDPKPDPKPIPIPPPKAQPTPCPKPCEEKIQAIRDAIDRNKRGQGGGMHGLKHRFQELIDGPCGPGQMPYRTNSRGVYKPTPVWENHVEEFESTKRALRNRFSEAVDAGCDIPDDLLDEAAEWDAKKPPTPDQWKGDPARPCTDEDPPADWHGPQAPEGMRGL